MADKNPNAPRGHLQGQGWPSWRFGPDGKKAVFQQESDVPSGWQDHPDKLRQPDDRAAHAPKPMPFPNAVSDDMTNVIPMTRQQITDALMLQKVEFSKNTPTQKLYELLLRTVEGAR